MNHPSETFAADQSPKLPGELATLPIGVASLLLLSPHPEASVHAAERRIEEANRDEVLAELQQMLHSKNPMFRHGALKGLLTQKALTPEAVEIGLEDADPNVVRTAVLCIS